MFNTHLGPAQPPEYLAKIAAAFVEHGLTEEQARARARIFFPNPKVLPEQQVADVMKMQQAVLAAGRAEDDFLVLNFERPSA